MQICATETIECPSLAVFETLARPDIYLSHWARGVLSAEHVAHESAPPYSRFRIVGRDLTGKVEWQYHVTGSEPSVSFTGRASGGPIAFREHFELAAVGDYTEVRVTQELHPGGVFVALSPLVSWLWPRLLRQNLKRLKTLIESQPQLATA